MKIVLYTTLTGSYEKLIQPSCVDDKIDYICFSNDIDSERVGAWIIKRIPFDEESPRLLSRYPKMYPNLLLSEYDYSLYIDANVEILDNSFYNIIWSLVDRKVVLAGMWHNEVDCAYEEGLRVIISGKEKNRKAVVKLMRLLKRDGFPYHYGMYEANCIFRSNHNMKLEKQAELWWNCYYNYAHRDQLSFSYSLWKYEIPFEYILPIGENTRNSKILRAGGHNNPSSSRKKILKKLLYRPTLFLFKLWILFTQNVDN